VHDRVQVFVDGSAFGSASRQDGDSSVHIPAGSNMDFLVENMGRINGPTNFQKLDMYDYKGLIMKPPVDGTWTARCLPLTGAMVQSLNFSVFTKVIDGRPFFMRGAFQVSGTPRDTFLDTAELTKGVIWVNGHNIGRFWATRGPQQTLYVPASFLKSGVNEVIVLDLEGSAAEAIRSVAAHRWSVIDTPQHIFIVEVNVVIAIFLMVAGFCCRYCRGSCRNWCRRCCCKKWDSQTKLVARDDFMDDESPRVLLDGHNRYRLMAG